MSETKLVARNILWNFAGNALPLLAGLIAFPLLLRGLGVERFGILSIAWVLVGYFGLFDLGLSRAVTHLVAERLGQKDSNSASQVASTALLLMWLLGVVAGIALWMLAPWLALDLLKIPETIKQEAVISFRTLAISIPFVIHAAGLRGLLEAYQAFRIASQLRMVLGVATFLGPVAALLLGGSLVSVIGALIGIRFVAWYAHLRAVKQLMQFDGGISAFDRQWLKPLLTFGGWMTVTNVVGPLMVYLDRFVIGATLSVAAVSYYTIPYEVITRAWVVSAAVTGVLFPVFSACWKTEPEKSALYMKKGALYTIILLFPPLATLSYFAPEILSIWLGEDFVMTVVVVLRWLAAGVLIGSVSQIFFALVQGAGRSDWTAKLHLAEAIPYWVLLLYLLEEYGVEGAAIAWLLRTLVDTIALMWLGGKLSPIYKTSLRLPIIAGLLTMSILLVATQMESFFLRSAVLLISLIIFSLLAWRLFLGESEREKVKKSLLWWRRSVSGVI